MQEIQVILEELVGVVHEDYWFALEFILRVYPTFVSPVTFQCGGGVCFVAV